MIALLIINYHATTSNYHPDIIIFGANNSCYTCASTDYEPLFERFSAFRHSTNIPLFGEFCDSLEQLHTFAPLTKCASTCVSIIEPQYFGGVQSLNTPYAYIRGCAEKIFSSVRNHPPEVDFLHSEAICLKLPLSQIWPSIQTDEHVQVSVINTTC
ncbi:CRE-HOT-5 protein [Dirofilaria immitis]|nr:CRE-HOT-5 protein [Dirofilaria immitis]